MPENDRLQKIIDLFLNNNIIFLEETNAKPINKNNPDFLVATNNKIAETNQDMPSGLNKTYKIINGKKNKNFILFINNVLTESINGEPAYYNSNILGRYMRKDYYETGTQVD